MGQWRRRPPRRQPNGQHLPGRKPDGPAVNAGLERIPTMVADVRAPPVGGPFQAKQLQGMKAALVKGDPVHFHEAGAAARIQAKLGQVALQG